MRKITDLLSHVKEPCVRAKLVTAWGRLVAAGLDGNILEDALIELDELSAMMKEETNDKVTNLSS